MLKSRERSVTTQFDLARLPFLKRICASPTDNPLMEPENPQTRSAELSIPEIARFLGERLGEPITDVVRIPHGEWSRAFGFRYGGADYVVRFSAVEADFRKDHLASSYASVRLPIPRQLAVGAAFDGFYAISTRAPGSFLDDLDAASMQRTLPALFDLLDTFDRS